MAAGGLVVGGCFLGGAASGLLVARVAARARPEGCPPLRLLRFPRLSVVDGVLFAAVGLRYGASWSLVPELALVAGLVPLALTDASCLRLPRRLAYPTLAAVAGGVAVAAVATGDGRRGAISLACGTGWAGAYFVVNRACPRLLGFGDVRLAPSLGLALGWIGPGQVVAGFLVANVFAVAGQATLVALRRATWSQALPLGAYLSAGAVVVLLA